MDRYAPHLLIASGLGLSLAAAAGAACFVFMGFGSSFAASSTEMADRVFQTMLFQLVACAAGVVVGLVMFVAGLVVWRRRKRATTT